MINVLSLGAGVQSTTLALRAAHGEITPMPDLAVFADTGAEPEPVYRHLEFLKSTNVLPFPIKTVRNGDITADLRKNIAGLSAGKRSASAPFWTVSRDPKNKNAMLSRQCTDAYKLDPIYKFLRREVLGLKPGARAPKVPVITVWIGISTDEAHRAKPSRWPFVENRHPLLEAEHRMRRYDCLLWLKRHDYPEPPKSACVFCPYRSNAEWRYLRDRDPAGWAEAQKIDEEIRGGLRGTDGPLFLHRTLKPLSEVDIRSDEDKGQASMFGNECEGICGV